MQQRILPIHSLASGKEKQLSKPRTPKLSLLIQEVYSSTVWYNVLLARKYRFINSIWLSPFLGLLEYARAAILEDTTESFIGGRTPPFAEIN